VIAGWSPVAGFPTFERDEGAESAGRGDESSHASPPAPALAVGGTEGNPTADGKANADFPRRREVLTCPIRVNPSEMLH